MNIYDDDEINNVGRILQACSYKNYNFKKKSGSFTESHE